MNTKRKAEKYYNKYLKLIEKEIGNKSTNTHDLNKMGKKLFGKKYIGAVPSDKIPVLKKNKYLIVNNEDSTQGGEHWLGVIKTDNDNVYIYDSFGRRHYKILPELKQSGNGYVLETENDPEQHKLEYNCGARCMASLMVYDNHGLNYFKFI